MDRRLPIAALAAFMLSASALSSAAGAELAVGCNVMPCMHDVSIKAGDRLISTADGVRWPQVVKASMGQFLYLDTGRLAGWVLATDVMPLDQAIPYYTAQIDKVSDAPRRQQLYRLRAQANAGLAKHQQAIDDYSKAIALGKSADLLVDRASQYHKLDRFKQSIGDCDTAIGLDPKGAGAYRMRARSKGALEKNSGAMVDVNRAIELDPADDDNYAVRSLLRLFAHDEQGALSDIDRGIGLAPTAEHYVWRAVLHFFRSDFAAADADLQAALRMEPSNHDATIMRSVICAVRGDPDHVDPRSNDPKTASTLRCLRSAAYLKRRDYECALAEVAEAGRLDPEDPDGLPWLLRVSIYMAAENYRAAIDQLNERLRRKPDDAAAVLFRAVCYSALVDYPAALADYQTAVRLSPRAAQGHVGCGLVRMKMGEHQAAFDDLNRAARLAPSRTSCYYWRSQVNLKLKRYRQGIADCDRAIELKRREAAKPAEQLAQKDGRIKLSLKLFSSSDRTDEEKTNGSLAEYHAIRSGGHYARGNYRDAIADFEEALRLDPDSCAGLNAQAWFRATCPQADLRNGAQAVACARKACEKSKWREADCLITLAAACAEAGQFVDAMGYQQRAIALLPKPELQAANERLTLYRQGSPYRTSPSHRLAQLF